MILDWLNAWTMPALKLSQPFSLVEWETLAPTKMSHLSDLFQKNSGEYVVHPFGPVVV